MDGLKILEIAGTAASLALVILVFYLVGLISKLKETLGQVDKTLREASAILADLDVEIKPVIQAVHQGLERLSALSQKGERLVEEVSALPPAARELICTLNDILKDTAKDLQEVLVQVRALLTEGEKRISSDVPDMLQEVDRLLAELNAIVAEVHQKLAKTEELFRAVEEAGKASKLVAQIVSKNVAEAAIEVAAVATGLRTTLKVLREKFVSGGEKNV